MNPGFFKSRRVRALADLREVEWEHSTTRPCFASAGEVHLWRISRRQAAFFVEALRLTLSPDELERAARYHFERDQEHFIVTRGAVRDILSRYLSLAPHCVRFSYNRYGKPSLSVENADNSLAFNVSGSGGVALCAVTRGREIGVDVEFVGKPQATAEIAERFFSESEKANLQNLPANQKITAFFRCWTRKESYIKAVGTGLSQPLQTFSVPIGEESLTELEITDNFLNTRRWSLMTFSPYPDYVAALAVEAEVPPVRFWQWSPPPEKSTP